MSPRKTVFSTVLLALLSVMAASLAQAALNSRESVPVTQNTRPGQAQSATPDRDERRAAALAECLRQGEQQRFAEACFNNPKPPRLTRQACEEKARQQNEAFCKNRFK